jgi:hypothetical protein
MRAWKWVCLILILGSFVLSGGLVLVTAILSQVAHIEEEWPILVVLAFLPVPVGVIATLVLAYKLWRESRNP